MWPRIFASRFVAVSCTSGTDTLFAVGRQAFSIKRKIKLEKENATFHRIYEYKPQKLSDCLIIAIKKHNLLVLHF